MVIRLIFCDNLKKARQRVGLTQQQIANALGVTKSTYCGYETGKRQPDIPKLRRLALLLCTSVDDLLGLTDGDGAFAVSASEFDIIKLYRSLDAYGQRIVRMLLTEEHARMNAQMREIIQPEDAGDLAALPIALSPVTGEISAYLGPDGFTTLMVHRSELPPNVCFALRVRGGSLAPNYKHDDILLISDSKPQPGDVGLFLRDSHGFIRLMSYCELLSVNPVYPPIPMDESIHPCGTVIGVLSPSAGLSPNPPG